MKKSTAPTHDVEACEEAVGESAGWIRILGNLQGEENGWKGAAAALRVKAGEAFAAGKDQLATQLRFDADILEQHPRLAELRKEQTDAYEKHLHFETITEQCPTGGVHE